jgi:translation initiation factor IF-1
MSRNWIIGVALAAALALPLAARAHEGHAHKVLGTVTSVQGNHVEVKTTDGKVVTIRLDAKTAITRGKTKLDATALKAGERVSVDYVEEKKINTAKTVKLGEARGAAKK